MNAEVIHQQAKGWVIPSLGERPQEAIFQMPDGQPPPSPKPLNPPCTRASSPGQQRVNVKAPPKDETIRRQKGWQRLMHQHPPVGNPEPCSSGWFVHRVGQCMKNPLR